MTGIVDHQTGTRDVRLLKGIGKAMPVTGAIALIGAFSMAGLPPFSGFLSKEMFLDAATQAAGNLSFLGDFAILIPIVAVAASLLTFVYSVAIFGKVFCGKKTAAQPPKQPKEGSWGMLIPALALVSFNILVGFFPNFFGHYLLEPAASVVAGAPQEMHIAFWHGFNLPLLLTAIVIIGGLLVYWYYDRWWSKLKDIHWRIGANAAYEAWLRGLPKFAKKLYDCQFTERLNDYNAVTLVASVLLIGSAFLYYQLWDTIRLADFAPVDILEFTLAIVTVVAAVGVAKFKRRLWAIMSLSIVGYGVSFFFVLFRAPDLALTQLLVETISLILYLLVLYKLPYGMTAVPPSTKRRKRTNAVIAVCVGATMTLLTLLAHSNKLFDSIAWYYMAYSKELGGGDNIVNVILVDFRGLDTMGEITVLGLAAIGVFVVIKLGRRRLLSREGYPQGNPEEFHDTGLDLAQKRDEFSMELDPAVLVGEKEFSRQMKAEKEAGADAKRRN